MKNRVIRLCMVITLVIDLKFGLTGLGTGVHLLFALGLTTTLQDQFVH